MLNAVESLIPQFAESGLLPRRRRVGAVYLEIELQLDGQFVDEAIRFWKEVAGIEQHDRYAGHDQIHQVQHYGGLRAEAGGEHIGTRQELERLLHTSLRCQCLEGAID